MAIVTSVGVFINVSCWVNGLNMPKVPGFLYIDVDLTFLVTLNNIKLRTSTAKSSESGAQVSWQHLNYSIRLFAAIENLTDYKD